MVPRLCGLGTPSPLQGLLPLRGVSQGSEELSQRCRRTKARPPAPEGSSDAGVAGGPPWTGMTDKQRWRNQRGALFTESREAQIIVPLHYLI